MAIVKSLAGTEAMYLEAQVRLKGPNAHFQAECEEVNRDYGWSFNVPAEGLEPILALKDAGAETNPSMAGTPPRYVPVQIRPYPNGKLHVQAKSDVAIAACPERRPYGVATNLDASNEVLEQAADLIAEADPVIW